METTLEFDECDTKHCVNVTVSNDVILELVESFLLHLSGQLATQYSTQYLERLRSWITEMNVRR